MLIRNALLSQDFTELTMDEFTSFSQSDGQRPPGHKVSGIVVVDTGCYTLSAIKYAADLMSDEGVHLGQKWAAKRKPKMIVLETQLSVEEVLAQRRSNLQVIAV